MIGKRLLRWRQVGEVQMQSQEVFRDDALAGKVILVTGGGGGLGREIAHGLSGRKAKVHICGRRQGLLDDTAGEIRASPVRPFMPIPATSAMPTQSTP